MYNQYLTALVEYLPYALAVWFFLIFVSCKKGRLSAFVLSLWPVFVVAYSPDITATYGTEKYLQEFINMEINLLSIFSTAAIITSMLLKYNRNVYKHCALLLCMVFIHCVLIYTLKGNITIIGMLTATYYHELTVTLLLLHFWVARDGLSNIIRSLNAIRLYLQYSDNNNLCDIAYLLTYQTGFKRRL